MNRLVLIPLAALALTACQKQSTDTANGTTASAIQPPITAAALGIKPGRWEHKVEILDVQGADVPPAVVAAMKANINKNAVATSCITAEEAAKGASSFLASDALKKVDCHFDKAEMAGGKISSAMTCHMPGGGTMVTHSTGTYSATEYSVDGEIEHTGRMSMTEKTRTSGHWVGECTGNEGVAGAAK